MAASKILIVATSADTLNGHATGSWLEEIAAPYYVFKANGYAVDIASVKGGKIPLDEASLSGDFLTETAKRFQADVEASSALKNSSIASSVGDVFPYAAIFIPGGHGIAADGPNNADLQKLLIAFHDAGKVISAVCHGPVALTHVKLPDGKWLVQDKKVTGFSNSEEEAVGKTEWVPFLLEDRLREEGGLFSKEGDWSEYTQTDGKLVTGQNPQSSEAVGKAVVAVLKGN